MNNSVGCLTRTQFLCCVCWLWWTI